MNDIKFGGKSLVDVNISCYFKVFDRLQKSTMKIERKN